MSRNILHQEIQILWQWHGILDMIGFYALWCIKIYLIERNTFFIEYCSSMVNSSTWSFVCLFFFSKHFILIMVAVDTELIQSIVHAHSHRDNYCSQFIHWHVFGRWEKIKVPQGNPHGHMEGTQNSTQIVTWAQDQTMDPRAGRLWH